MVGVPSFQLHVVNSEFSCSEDIEAADLEAARQQGLRAALGIGVDEVVQGSPFFAAEIRLESDGEMKQRFLVSIGHSLLM